MTRKQPNCELPGIRENKEIEILPQDHQEASNCDQILSLTSPLHSHCISLVQIFL